MNMHKGHSVLVASAILVMLAGVASAASLGDEAAPLVIKEWVKGDPVSITPGTTYIIEFWATWCGPCKRSIPHISEVQKNYADKGVVVIGITDEEDLEKVKAFVTEMGDDMAYTVAMDDAGQTNTAYMKAFGVSGIPHAFIVDKHGVVCWNGHPMDRMEAVLDQVLAGTFDVAKRREVAKAEALVPVYGYLGTKTDEVDLALEAAKRILKYGESDAAVLKQMASITIDDGFRSPDLELAEQAIKRAYELSGGEDAELNETYYQVLKKLGRDEEAKKYRKEAIGAFLEENLKQ